MRLKIFILLFLKYLWALPAQQVSNSGCSTEGSFFNPKSSYNYSIEFEISTGFIAWPKEKAGNISVKGECLAGLNFLSPCVGRFKLYNCNFLQRAEKFGEGSFTYTPFDGLTTFGDNLEKNGIHFKHDGEKIISIYYEHTLNDGALLNFQKSLLSTLLLKKNINSLTEGIISESDVFGKCPSQYEIVGDELVESFSQQNIFQQVTNNPGANDLVLKRIKHIHLCENPNSPTKYWFYNDLAFEPKQECSYVIRDLSKVVKTTCEEEYAIPITGTLTLVKTSFTLVNDGPSSEEPIDLKAKTQGTIAFLPITNFSAPQIENFELLGILKRNVPSSEIVDDNFLSSAALEYERILEYLKSQDDSNNIMSVWQEILKLPQNQEKIKDYLKDILLECYQPGCAQAKFLILKSHYDASFEQKVITSMGLHETAPDTLPIILEWCKRHTSTHCLMALGNGLTFVEEESSDVPRPSSSTIERVFAYIHSQIPADCRAGDNLLLDNAVISLHHAIELATNYSKLSELHQSLEQCVQVHKLHYPVLASNALHVLAHIPKIRENHLNQLMLEVIKDPHQITANKLQAFVVLLTRNSSNLNDAIEIYINMNERNQLKSFVSSLLLLDQQYDFNSDIITIFRQKLYEKDYVPDMKPRYPYTTSHAFLIKHPLELSFIKKQNLEILTSILYDQRSYLPSDIQMEFMLNRDGQRVALYAGITSAGPFLEKLLNELWESKNLIFDAEKLEIHQLLDPFKSIYQTLQVLVKTYLPLYSLPPMENMFEKFSQNKQNSQALKDIISIIINKNRQKPNSEQSVEERKKYPDARFYISTEERMITYEPLENLVNTFLTTIKTTSLIDVIYAKLKDNHILNWISKLDIDHVLPTICGIPIKILARVKIGLYLKSLITTIKSWNFDGRRSAYLDSSVAMEIPKYWSGKLKRNLRVENNIKFDVKITSSVGQLKLDFEIPKSNYKIYNYNKDHAVVVNGKIFKLEKVKNVTVRQTPVYCSSKVLASVLGFEICRQVSNILYETDDPYFGRSTLADPMSEESWLKPIGTQSTALAIDYQVKRRPSWNPFNYGNYYFSNLRITLSNDKNKIEIDRMYEPDKFWKLGIITEGGEGYKADFDALLSPNDKKLIIKLNGPSSNHNQYLAIQDKVVTHQSSDKNVPITKQFSLVFHESHRSSWNLTADRFIRPSNLILKSTLIQRCNSFICNLIFSGKPFNETSITHFDINYTLHRGLNESILHNVQLNADTDQVRNLSATLTFDFAQTNRAFTIVSLYSNPFKKCPIEFNYKWTVVLTIKKTVNEVSIANHHQFKFNTANFENLIDIKHSRGNKEFITELDVHHLPIPPRLGPFRLRFYTVIKKDVNPANANYFGTVLYNMSEPHIHFKSQWGFINNRSNSDLLIECSDQYFNRDESPGHTGKTKVWLNFNHDPLDLRYDVSYNSADNKLQLHGMPLNGPDYINYARKDKWISTIPNEALLNFDLSCQTNVEKDKFDQSCESSNFLDNATYSLNINYKNGLELKLSKIWKANPNPLLSLSSGTFSVVIADSKGHINWTMSNLGIIEGLISHTDKGLETSVLFIPKTSNYGISSMKVGSLELVLRGKRGLSYNITVHSRFQRVFTAYYTKLNQEIKQKVADFHPYLSILLIYHSILLPKIRPRETYDYQGYYVKPLPGIWPRSRLDYMFLIIDVPSSVLYGIFPWSRSLIAREQLKSAVYAYFGQSRIPNCEPLLTQEKQSFFVHHPFYWSEIRKAPEITISSLSTYFAQKLDTSDTESSDFEVPSDALYTYASILDDQLITFDGVHIPLPKGQSTCSHLLAHDGLSNRFSLILLNDLSLLLYTQEWVVKISFMVKDLGNFTRSRSISVTLNDNIITSLPYKNEKENATKIAIYFDDEKLHVKLPGIKLACEAHPRYSHEKDEFREQLLSCLFGLSPIYHASILGNLANNDLEPSNDLAIGQLEKFSICSPTNDVQQKTSQVRIKGEHEGKQEVIWDFEACFKLYRWNYLSDLYDCFGVVDPNPYFQECRAHYAGMKDKYHLPCNPKLACQVMRKYQSMCHLRGINIESLGSTCERKSTIFPPYTIPTYVNPKFDVIFLLDEQLSSYQTNLVQSLEREIALSLKKANPDISVKFGLLSPYELSDQQNFDITESPVDFLPKYSENSILMESLVSNETHWSTVRTTLKDGGMMKHQRCGLISEALSLYKSRPGTTMIFISISKHAIKLQSNRFNIPFHYYQHLFWDENIIYLTIKPDQKLAKPALQVDNDESIRLGYPIHENLDTTLQNIIKDKNKFCRVCMLPKIKFARDFMECSNYPTCQFTEN